MKTAASVIFALALVFVGGRLTAGAAPVDAPGILADYEMMTWSPRDGLPRGALWALAQDRDGYLWLGSEDGLVRFDGTKFTTWRVGEPAQTPRPVRALQISTDGTLWVGFGTGEIGTVHGRTSRIFGERDGLTAGAISVLIQDAAGTLWAGGDNGLYSFANDHWRKWISRGLPPGGIHGAFVDDDGRFYVGTERGSFRRGANGDRFEPLESLEDGLYSATNAEASREAIADEKPDLDSVMPRSFPRSFVERRPGQVLVNDWNRGFRIVGQPALAAGERGRGVRLLIDRRADLWVATGGQGLWRVRSSVPNDGALQQVDRLNALTGLPNNGVTVLFEDRDGNIWTGVREGLVRLRPRTITQVTDIGLAVAIQIAPTNDIWVGTTDELLLFTSGRLDKPPAHISLGGARLRAMHADRSGTLWVSTDRHLLRLLPGEPRLSRLPQFDTMGRLDQITSDAEGGLWLFGQDVGLLHWSHERIERVPLSFGRGQRVDALRVDRNKRLWIAFGDGRLGVVPADGDARVFGIDDGFDIGACRQIFEDDTGGMWLAGSEGLSRFLDGRFVSIQSGPDFPIRELVAVEKDSTNDLWIGSTSGVFHLERQSLEDVVAGRATRVRFDRYTTSNGLAGHPNPYDRNLRVVRAGDGRLWFITARGLSLIDPDVLRANRHSSPVTIEYAVVNEKRIDAVPGVRLSPATARLSIAYSQLNLSSPLLPQFRYRLDGYDSNWVDAGTDLVASYTNLPPRSYRFHVVAMNDDGTELLPAASWEFSIRPKFYRTAWFAASAILAACASFWGAWQFRVQHVRRRYSLLLGERVRMSRELHDTLLQNLVGVAIRCDMLAGALQVSSPATQMQFVRLRKDVEAHIRDTRQAIWDLRSPRQRPVDLSDALRASGEHATANHDVSFAFSTSAVEGHVPIKVAEQLLRIGQEAIANAVRHARATCIAVELTFRESSIALRVEDDGRGFDPSQCGTPTMEHYGLGNMRERAQEIGARLEVLSRPLGGTTVIADVAWTE